MAWCVFLCILFTDHSKPTAILKTTLPTPASPAKELHSIKLLQSLKPICTTWAHFYLSKHAKKIMQMSTNKTVSFLQVLRARRGSSAYMNGDLRSHKLKRWQATSHLVTLCGLNSAASIPANKRMVWFYSHTLTTPLFTLELLFPPKKPSRDGPFSAGTVASLIVSFCSWSCAQVGNNSNKPTSHLFASSL